MGYNRTYFKGLNMKYFRVDTHIYQELRSWQCIPGVMKPFAIHTSEDIVGMLLTLQLLTSAGSKFEQSRARLTLTLNSFSNP